MQMAYSSQSDFYRQLNLRLSWFHDSLSDSARTIAKDWVKVLVADSGNSQLLFALSQNRASAWFLFLNRESKNENPSHTNGIDTMALSCKQKRLIVCSSNVNFGTV